MKKLTALFGSCLFFFIVMTMYLLLDQFQVAVDKQKFIEEVNFYFFQIIFQAFLIEMYVHVKLKYLIINYISFGYIKCRYSKVMFV